MLSLLLFYIIVIIVYRISMNTLLTDNFGDKDTSNWFLSRCLSVLSSSPEPAFLLVSVKNVVLVLTKMKSGSGDEIDDSQP